MKNLLVKIALVTLTLSTSLIVMAWMENLSNLDIALTKNRYFQNQLKIEIEKSSDSVKLKKRTVELIEAFYERHLQANKISTNVQELLSQAFVLAACSIVLVAIEVVKRRKS